MSTSRQLAQGAIASSMGTVFEWYDLFLFGTLAPLIARNFTEGGDGAGFIFALGAFAAGFIMRPFGALFFGSMGDRVGRKKTFLVTISLMGGSTAALGLLPKVSQVGIDGHFVRSVSVVGSDATVAAAMRQLVATDIRSLPERAGYPIQGAGDEASKKRVLLWLLVFLLAAAALYGPQAAALVELFPANVRYTALSVPYNIGTGWIGGLEVQGCHA